MGSEWNDLFPFLTRLKGNLANKNLRERCRPLELRLNLAGGQTLVYPAAESKTDLLSEK